MIRLGSIDIGGANFSQYIEDVDSVVLQSLYKKYHSLQKSFQRKYKGPMNNEIQKIITRVCNSGTRIQTGVYNLRENESENTWTIPNRLILFNHLEKYKYLWESCDVIFIEQQFVNLFSKSKKTTGGDSTANIDAIKIGENTLSWLLINFPLKLIMYFGSQYKTQIMGAENGLTKYQRKSWSSKFAREIYLSRNDLGMKIFYDLVDQIKFKRLDENKIQKILENIKSQTSENDIINLCENRLRNKQKLDDISDACVQCQAFKMKFFVGDF